MSLFVYKMIAPTLLVSGLMMPAIALWVAGEKTNFTYGQDEPSFSHYLHPAPIMVPDNDGSYRSFIVKMKVRDFRAADTICRYFPRIRDNLYFQMLDYPKLMDQKIGTLNHGSINFHSTIEEIIGKGRVSEVTLLDKETMGSKKELHGEYKCYGQHAEIIINKNGA